MNKFLSLLILFLLAVTSISLWWTQGNMPRSSVESGTAAIGGAFALTNQDGKPMTEADLRGHVSLVFFGFTHCPDICPVSSATMGKVLNTLGDKASQFMPVFITVDPERDTPDVMKTYLGAIDARITGLTGSKEQIEHAAAAYKAYYAKSGAAEPNAHGAHGDHDSNAQDYMVDHSGFMYLMDKNGQYVQHFPYDAPAEDITDAVLKLLE